MSGKDLFIQSLNLNTRDSAASRRWFNLRVESQRPSAVFDVFKPFCASQATVLGMV